VLEVLDARVPGVDLEDADLHQPDESGQVVDDEILAGLPLFVDLRAPERRRCPQARVLPVKALVAEALRRRTSVVGRSRRCGRIQSPIDT
jgi:hypothetical protein